MATLFGKNHDIAYNKKDKTNTNMVHGRVRELYDEFDFSAGAAVGDKILLGRLQKGWRVAEATLSFTDLGTTGVAVLGYEYIQGSTPDASLVDDDNAFLDAVDVNAKADTISMTDQDNMVGHMLELQGEANVVLKFTTATTATAGKIKCAIQYVAD